MPAGESQLSRWKHAYQVLGVSHNASALVIRQAHRRLVKRWHPDLYPAGTPEHADANRMTVLINEAYSDAATAPLRYFGATLGQTQTGAREEIITQSQADVTAQPDLKLPNVARIEFWVRFVCGVLFGILLSLDLAFTVFLNAGQYAGSLTVGFFALTLACGFASARYGDKFWYLLFRRWWLWP